MNPAAPDVRSPASQATRTRKLIRWGTVTLVALSICWGAYEWAQILISKTCRLAQKEQRWADLEVWSLRWTKWQPHEANAWLMLADAVQHQNRFLEAAEYLDQVPLDSPLASNALLLESELLFGPANRPLEGEIACRKLLSLEPRATKAHAHLIRFYAYTLQRNKLAQQFRDAVAAEQEPPDAYIYFFLADSLNMAQGEKLNTLWLTSNPDHELFLVARALQWRDKNEIDLRKTADVAENAVLNDRESHIVQLLERFPHNANLLADQIDAEIVKGRLNRVLELMARAPGEAETDNRFWRAKGWVHYAKQEFSEAEAAYRHALQLHPMDWISMNRLVEVLRSQQESTETARIKALVQRIQELRTEIRSVESIENCPLPLLRKLGRLARDCGDTFVADALEQRLGSAEEASL